MKRILLVATTALTLAGGVSAQAQYGGGYDDDRPRRYEERRSDEDRYERRRPRYDEDRYERRRSRYDDDRFDRAPRGGGICVTARGNCMTRPAPINAPCGCEVPGFGFKRGAIGG
ncbi:hypothetical protein [Methylobacterium sp. Leaf466]|uniref:hypothetical protein n=1 Tax=Methylobacterium sp. Leaf466 TaxID=1736386 RepID=UPI000AC84E66|nr:hypothetical protein [Methylobacterium sp. Leaf466]